MLSLFRQEGLARIDELHGAIAACDLDVVYRLAHTMKGEALAWGASDLAAASRRLEDGARAGLDAELPRLIAELHDLFNATLAALHGVRRTAA